MQLKSLLLAWPCLLTGFTADASPIGPQQPAEQLREKAIFRRGQVLDHDKIVGLPELLPFNLMGQHMKNVQPYFNTEGPGCWPYPAIDVAGDVSGGLKLGGPQGGDCEDSIGQVYVRYDTYGNHTGIMYAYYAPKDQTEIGGGHRHEWEAAVIWLDDITVEHATIQGGSVSMHGGWEGTTDTKNVMHFKDSHPLCKYYVDVAVFGTHRMGWTNKVGGLQPAVFWDLLTEVEQSALQDTDWGNADFPLGYTFERNLAAAYPFREN
ncbi:hypothetical protein E4U55_003475 [Claviceps digitariae]|nr:hypothetical protein E4U55_003475 [Claviceps digitariae]